MHKRRDDRFSSALIFIASQKLRLCLFPTRRFSSYMFDSDFSLLFLSSSPVKSYNAPYRIPSPSSPSRPRRPRSCLHAIAAIQPEVEPSKQGRRWHVARPKANQLFCMLMSMHPSASLHPSNISSQCHRDVFLVGPCSRCTLSGSSCSCPDALTRRSCSEGLVSCAGMAYGMGEMCGSLSCFSGGGAGGTGSGGTGGSGSGGSGICPAGYKTCAAVWCIKEDQVCCGADESKASSCRKGQVCVQSGGEMMCAKAGSDGAGAGGSASAASQGGASGGDGTVKTGGGARFRGVEAWVGVVGVVVGGFLL